MDKVCCTFCRNFFCKSTLYHEHRCELTIKFLQLPFSRLLFRPLPFLPIGNPYKPFQTLPFLETAQLRGMFGKNHPRMILKEIRGICPCQPQRGKNLDEEGKKITQVSYACRLFPAPFFLPQRTQQILFAIRIKALNVTFDGRVVLQYRIHTLQIEFRSKM